MELANVIGNLEKQFDVGKLTNEVGRIKETIDRLRQTSRAAGDLVERVASVERAVDELRLYVAVLVRAIACNELIPRGQLERIIEAVDASDGAVDGRLSHGPIVH